MNQANILTTLNTWRHAMQKVDAQMAKLTALVGNSPESPLPDAVYSLQALLTVKLAEQIDADPNMLTDWWLTHEFGAKPMQAGFVGEPLRTIDSNAMLADFIAEDARASA